MTSAGTTEARQRAARARQASILAQFVDGKSAQTASSRIRDLATLLVHCYPKPLLSIDEDDVEDFAARLDRLGELGAERRARCIRTCRAFVKFAAPWRE